MSTREKTKAKSRPLQQEGLSLPREFTVREMSERTKSSRFTDYYSNRVEVALTNNEFLLIFSQLLPGTDKLELQDQCRIFMTKAQAVKMKELLARFEIDDKEEPPVEV